MLFGDDYDDEYTEDDIESGEDGVTIKPFFPATELTVDKSESPTIECIDDTDDDENPGHGYSMRYIAVSISVIVVFDYIAERISIPVLPIFVKEDLHSTDSMLGVAVGAAGLGKIFGGIPSGYLVTSFGPKRGAILGVTYIYKHYDS